MAKEDRLLSQLNTSKTAASDQALWQVIKQLIKRIQDLEALLGSGSTTTITNIQQIIQYLASGDSGGGDGEIGPPGVQGIQGVAGITGAMGPVTLGPMGLDADSPEEPWMIPGVIGPQGNMGPSGSNTLALLGFDGIDGEDGFPGVPGRDGTSGASAAWTLVATQVAAGATSYSFTGLSPYSEFLIVLDGLTLGTNTVAALQVSIDNGATYLTTYYSLANTGARTSETELLFWSGNSASARYAWINLKVGNTAAPEKPADSTSGTKYFINTTSAINALKVYASFSTTLNSGTIYVLGR